MNRRRALAAVAGAATLGAGVWAARRGGPAGDHGLPATVTTLDARGSSAGTVRLPRPDDVTVIDLFATWCPPCDDQLAELAPIADEGHATVVSVTNERFGGGFDRAALRDWWRSNGGDWTLAHDPDGDLMAALGATGLPHIAVVAPDGAVTWRHGGGVADAATIRERVAAAREG